MRYFYYLIIVLVISSCVFKSNSDRGNSGNDLSKRGDYVRELVKKVGFLKLPISYDILKGDFKSKYVTKKNSMDTLFFSSENEHIIGALPDTSMCFCLLCFQIGDLLYPKLLTIDKQGKIIDKIKLCLGVCGAPVDIDTSINRFEIERDLSIRSFYYCHGKVLTDDSIPKMIEVREKIYGFGRMTRTGRIEWTEKKD